MRRERAGTLVSALGILGTFVGTGPAGAGDVRGVVLILASLVVVVLGALLHRNRRGHRG